VFLSFLIKLN